VTAENADIHIVDNKTRNMAHSAVFQQSSKLWRNLYKYMELSVK
jgi:hypothetical protein